MSDQQNFYPPVGFYFSLSMQDVKKQAASFLEASGIAEDVMREDIEEQGENRFKYKLPSPPKYSDLVLKRGLSPLGSPLMEWSKSCLGSDLSANITPQTIILSLNDSNGNALKTWTFINAYPIKWQISDTNSKEGDVVIEAIEFAYTYFTSSDQQ